MNIDSIQGYTYPKLFTIRTRSQSRESMERSYAFFKDKARLDSVLIDTIYPISPIDKGHYAIAVFNMVIRIPLDSTEHVTNNTLTDTSSKKHPADNHLIDGTYPAPSSTLFAMIISEQFGIEVTGYDEINGMKTIRMKVLTIAAKDEYAKDWTFIAVKSDQELINKLFSKNVLEKLASYNKKE
jgi:hypothetical protein